jgi:carbonic anhydrase
MSVINELLEHNIHYAQRVAHSSLPTEPRRKLAVLTCMDSRLDLFDALGLELGDAHLIRNAGGIATDDVIRSILLSQLLLGTREVMVIHHTRCGLETFDEEELQNRIASKFDSRVPFRLGAFRDVELDVKSTIATLRTSPFIEASDIRGFVFDVDTSALTEVV